MQSLMDMQFRKATQSFLKKSIPECRTWRTMVHLMKFMQSGSN